MKILIVGGGIGGLTTALCCVHQGHEVIVFEQASILGDVGAGIQLPPNAMKIFEKLGLAQTLRHYAFAPQALEARMGESGRHIFSIPLTPKRIKKWGGPYLHIHRSDYIKVLYDALIARAPQAVRLGVDVARYRQDNLAATVTLIDGREFSGDVVIGADGIKSAVRAHMFGTETANFTGNIAWRAVVPMSELEKHVPNPTASVWMGRGRHAVTYLLRGGTLVNFVGIVERTDWTEESWREKGYKPDALKEFQAWHPVITTLLNAVPAETLYRWALFDRPPLPNWVDGRVALLGDAAHPMLPFLAQGAAMAVEDAWVVARELSVMGRAPTVSLNSYQAARLTRTRKVQMASRANMKTFHRRTTLGQLSTYGPMWLAGQMSPFIIPGRMDWLYGYDVT